MKIQTIKNLIKSGQLPMLVRIGNDFKHAYRLFFVASAQKNGFLKALCREPVPFQKLAKEFCKAEGSMDALKSWLDMGVHLGELKLDKNGYTLKGYSKKLSLPENDAMLAMIEEVVFLHHKIMIDTPSILKNGKLWGLEDQDGEMIARSSRMLEPFQTEAVDRFFPAAGPVRLLEVGCGSGFYAKYAAECNRDLTAVCVDLQPGVAEMARRNFETWKLTGRVNVEQGDIRDKKPEEFFDIVTLFNNIYYFRVNERKTLFKHLLSFLKPGGMLLITTCCKGGSLVTDVLDIWGTSTEGCGGLPAPADIKRQMKEAGFKKIQSKNLVPGESFYALAGYN
jgi:SAM-dependent methyltransferase